MIPPAAGPVVVLAGGTGGAKLARGMLDVVGAELTVVANTGDDVAAYGGHVSPDPDLVAFWLADVIDERGWGLRGDTFSEMERLRDAGEDVWFQLGDRDLAICRRRAERLRAGVRLTDAIAELVAELGVPARVLPMTDDPFPTIVHAGGRPWPFQEFMIRHRARGPVEGVEHPCRHSALPTSEVLQAIADARAVVIGPSNPVVSIGPILAVAGVRDALTTTAAPVVAVSPIVGGEVLKGPTAAFLEAEGVPVSAAGVATLYGDLLAGVVADEQVPDVPTHVTDVRMDDAAARRRVAEETLRFAGTLAA